MAVFFIVYLKPSDTMDAKMTFNIVSNSAKWRVKVSEQNKTKNQFI